MIVVKHDVADLRRQVRSQAPLAVRIDETTYAVKDWDPNGFRIGDFPNQGMAIGRRFFIQVTAVCQGLEVSFTTEVELVRLPREGGIVCRFLRLLPQEIKLLEMVRLTQGLNGAAPSLVDGLARVQVPVTATALAPSPLEAPLPSRFGRYVRRTSFTLLYWAAGILLATVIVTSLYWHFFRLDLEFAVVSLPLYPVVSQDLGRCAAIDVKEGDDVRTGQQLLHLDDDVLTRDLEIAQLQAAVTKVDLVTAEARVKKEGERLALSQGITEARLQKRQVQVSALTLQSKAGQALMDRLQQLLPEKATSQEEINRVELLVADVAGNLAMSKAELQIEQHALQALKHGSFYDGRRLMGDLQQFVVNLEDARERHQVALERVKLASARAKRLAYCAPFDGKVIKVLNVAGGTTNRGDALVILEKAGEEVVIDCFVTQDEANSLTLDAAATVWVPALAKSYTARVTKIDRTSGFLADMQANLKDAQVRYSWRGQQDRSALVQLGITLSPDERKDLGGGMPAVVSVPRTPTLWHRIQSLF